MFDTPQPAQAGTLYIVATPIGNLRDLSLRALDVLKTADILAAEDTRNTQGLLRAFGIQARLTALHEHNEENAAARLIDELRTGKSVAYVSDAGTPGISDPGARLVRMARDAGLTIVPIPGPSAVAAALSVAGLEGPWLFNGFLPAKPSARRKALEALADLPCAMVFYEAPHRIRETVDDLLAVLGGVRPILFARELTKRFEQLHRCPLAEAPAWLAEDDNHARGEFVLVVEAPHPQPAEEDNGETRRVLEILLAELTLKQAAALAVKLTGARKNALYQMALEMKPEGPGQAPGKETRNSQWKPMDRITLTRPDDWHLHLRDGAMLAAVLPDTARRFARAIVMPNLRPPVRSVAEAAAYRERILAALPVGLAFTPLMTLYLTDNTTPDEIFAAKASGFVQAVKYYPAGATTNSDSGVTDIRKVDAVLEAMAEAGLPLLLHGEVTDADVDIFDREAVFIDRILAPLLDRLPRLRVVLEHITTRQAAEFVRGAPGNVAATLTAHHLLYNRNAMFQGGIRPHYYCLPVLKREVHRRALVEAAVSGNPKFFLGTDSAPHARAAKETACGCAGCFTAPAALEFYAEAFDRAGALDRLEGFASFHGPDFYGLPRNTDRITLVRDAQTLSSDHPSGVVPLGAGEPLAWRLA